MSQASACEAWAAKEFGQAQLGDVRRTLRAVEMGASAAAAPAGPLTQAFPDAAERQAAYKLMEGGHAPASALARAAAGAAWSRVRPGAPYAVVPVDGSTLSVASARAAQGFGPVGTRGVKSLGLEAMSALLVSQRGVPLGLAAQALWTRGAPARGLSESQKRARPLEERETRYWLQVLQAACEAWRASGSPVVPWFQLDAGADARDVLHWAVWEAQGAWVTVRSGQQRCVQWPEEGLLWDGVQKLPVAGHYALKVPAGEKRCARRAHIAVRFSPVVVQLRCPSSGACVPVALFAVHAREEGSCPRGEAPIEWLLLTTRPVHGFQGAREVLRAYALRWRVEEVHRSWKSGCGVERSGLKARAFASWATVLFCVAVRIERLKRLARETPEVPASDEFSPHEVRALLLLKKQGALYARGHVPTLGEAVLWLAQLGGYTGKSSGGPPGATVLKRGLDKLAPVAAALRFQEELGK
ncbi:MAG TPA: IS4 family transposase [Aggregicoccus sp.]|nr:IS4 family transposase [Aggregicoccus sp.]